MLIGNRYSDAKLYSGIRHYDHLPLTSGDLHEYADILQMKNAFFMNNIIGSGPLNEPACILSSTGISLDSPSILLIDGDISLVQSDPLPLVTKEKITQASLSKGLVCIVGWYQSLNASSTLRAYGGVNNSILENDLIDEELDIQVSTRYQLRWDIVIVDPQEYDSGRSMDISIPARDDTGATVGGDITVTIGESDNTVRSAIRPSLMNYAVSDLYIVPILTYEYVSGNITRAETYKAIRPLGSNNFIKSSSEPPADERYEEGSIWYNPTTAKFRFYVEGVGFVPTASDLALLQYSSSVTMNDTTEIPGTVSVNIGISSLVESDILQVVYNGVVLVEGQNYLVDYTNNAVNLIDFTTEAGDVVTFIVIKLVDTTAVNSITTEFRAHVSTTGSSVNKGHVSLSDSASKSTGIERGVAATPKAVYDATTIIDSVTGKKYRLTVTNGVLGVVEVE